MSSIKSAIAISIITLFLLEISSLVLTKFDLFLINETPKIYKSNNHLPDVAYGRTERDTWGAWHKKNSSFTHSSACFDVVMTFNEVGARDSSFNNLKENTILLLGDSFAEGFGVSYEKTSQYKLEKILGIEVANFGSAGSFGPLQELILYKNFKYVPHNGLIIYLLPSNDFTDNDIETWERVDKKRFRPYFSNEGNPLEPYFFQESKKRDSFIETPEETFKQFLKDYFWISNPIRSAFLIVKGDTQKKFGGNIISKYYDSKIDHQKNLVLAYNEILNIAKKKDVLFVIIPGKNDIARFRLEKNPYRYQNQLWYKSLEAFTNYTNQNVSVLDLMDYLPDETEDLFFSCDGHWSIQGNDWAASVIANHILSFNLFKAIQIIN